MACDYRLRNGHDVTLRVGDYNPKARLVIDPVLLFSTYAGGSSFDAIYGMASDPSGNLYVTGETASVSLWSAAPPARTSRDAFVAKLNSAATQVLFTVYLGGSGDDSGKGIAVDGSGNVFVTGVTGSPNFPATNGALSVHTAGAEDAFVAKLDSAGNLLYSTYLGGVKPDYGLAIAVDSSGSAYVAGQTESTSFPITTGAFQTSNHGGVSDCFVSKLNSAGTALVYSTLLGGAALDLCSGIAVDAGGSAYVAGTTYSTDFPTLSPMQSSLRGTANAFVAKINASGSALVYSTFLGGSNADEANAITVDSSGAAYVAGTTSSTDFPVTASAAQGSLKGIYNAFVSKLSANGSTLSYSTLIGGSKSDTATSIAVDQSGRAILGGYTTSPDFPSAGTLQSAFQGAYDAFASVLDSNGASQVFNSSFGGSGDDRGYAVVAASGNKLYLAGMTASANFPTAAAMQPGLAAASDAFILEADYGANITTPAAMSSPTPGSTLSGASATFQWTAGSGVSQYWLYVSKKAPGRNDVFDSGGINLLSETVNTLPTDGSTLYVTLYSLIGSKWLFNVYTYNAAVPVSTAPAIMSSPAPGSTLPGVSVTFQWTTGSGVSQYWLYISKKAPGTNDIFDSGGINLLSETVNNLPTDGSTLYVTLYSLIGSTWTLNSYTYKAFTSVASSPAVMSSPAPGSTLSGASATFQWTAGSGVSQYWLYVSKVSAGRNDVFDSGGINLLSETVNNLPTDGSTLYVTLYSLIGSTWTFNSYTYKAFTSVASSPAVMSSPTPGSTLSGASATFQWTAGSGVSQYWLYISKKTAGSNDVFDSGGINLLSQTVNNLPTDGSTLYVTLYSLIGSAWTFNSYTYKAFTSVASSPAVMSSPAPGSTLPGASATFQWTAGSGVSQYWLYVSKISAGRNDVFDSGGINLLSKTVNNLPTDGSTLYVTLYSLIGSNWLFNVYTYQAF
ncbi:MAG: SBBP repeat-containing protein [Acidobacteriia bacterium]|nr:SBBP repeat-containing protein [Terriglobia bacterium]